MVFNLISSLSLYFSIVFTLYLLRERKAHIFGVFLVGACLLLFDLPDMAEYREHYQLAGRLGFEQVFSLYNFEPGYVAVVVVFSKIVSYEVFYIVAITLTIDAYLKFYRQNASDLDHIFAVCFFSICLYFVAFTIRTTIASMFLTYSLIHLKNKKNAIAVALIVVGSTFHAVIAPMIILPIINNFSSAINRNYLLVYAVAVVFVIFFTNNIPLELFFGLSELVDLKIAAYADANINSNSFYFGLWMIAALGSLISFRYFGEFDRVLSIGMLIIIMLLRSYEFIQGRFMWLTSFIFIYILVKGVVGRFHFGNFGGLMLCMILPILIFLRF